MSTFYDAMKNRLIENGLFDDMATKIMEIAIKSDDLNNMNGRWADHVDSYPPMLVNVTFQLIRPIAYKWICENAPQAWFRAAFSPGINGLKGKELEDYIDNYMTEKQGLKKRTDSANAG